jgi:hypothetical protein
VRSIEKSAHDAVFPLFFWRAGQFSSGWPRNVTILPYRPISNRSSKIEEKYENRGARQRRPKARPYNAAGPEPYEIANRSIDYFD